MQYRSIDCVWKSTEDSAGGVCNSRKIPKTVKQCTEVSCVTSTTTPYPMLRGNLFYNTIMTLNIMR